MTPYDVIRKAVPGADDSYCHYILWARTPFPFKRLTARDIYQAASRDIRASRNNIYLCDWCDRRVSRNQWTCWSCSRAFRLAREEARADERAVHDVVLSLRCNGVEVAEG